MTQYLVAIHLPDDYDPAAEDEATQRDIAALNDEMKAAGAVIFAGGLQPASSAKSLRVKPDGKVLVTDGAVHRDQGAHGRFLGAGSRRPGRGAGVGAQGRHRLSGAGRGAPVSLTLTLRKQLSGIAARGRAATDGIGRRPDQPTTNAKGTRP